MECIYLNDFPDQADDIFPIFLGFSGTPVNLVSNLFKLDRMTDFRLFQYHVDFRPDVPNKAMRKAMIQEHTDVIGKIFMFDGMILFLPIQLNDVGIHFDVSICA